MKKRSTALAVGVAVLGMTVALPWTASASALSGGEFLNLPLDVRGLGMGEAGMALAKGPGAVPSNPAALCGVESHHAYFTHSFQHAGIGSDFVAYGATFGRHHLGAGFYHAGYGSLSGRDDLGNLTGGFWPADTAYDFSYGTDFHGIDLAGTLKLIESRIQASDETLTFDVGGLYRLGEHWAFGLAGRNILGELKYEGLNHPLPTAVAGSMAWRAVEGWWFGLDVVLPVYSDSYVAIGTEYVLPIKGVGSLAVRLGCNTKSPDLGLVSGLRTGVGFVVGPLDFDYAFGAMGELGQAHHLSAGYRFGIGKKERKP